MIVPWMWQNVHIVANFSRTDVLNKKGQEKEKMFFSRDDYKDAFDYWDYSRLCYDVYKFTELSPDLFNFEIMFPLRTYGFGGINSKIWGPRVNQWRSIVQEWEILVKGGAHLLVNTGIRA